MPRILIGKVKYYPINQDHNIEADRKWYICTYKTKVFHFFLITSKQWKYTDGKYKLISLYRQLSSDTNVKSIPILCGVIIPLYEYNEKRYIRYYRNKHINFFQQ